MQRPFSHITVAQLIEALRQLPQDAMVVAASDGEGNNFELVYEVTTGNYIRNLREFMDTEWHEEGEEPLPINAVCIWPVG